MHIPRIYADLNKHLKPNKALILYGPRQVGKTTLLQDFLGTSRLRHRLDSGDNIKIHHILGSQDFNIIKEYAEGYELIALDEAQRIPNIGQGLKILVDQIPGIFVIATGSSSFELSGQVGEPLTGRKISLILYPVSSLELSGMLNRQEMREQLEERLIYGSYPEVITSKSLREKKRILEEITQSYLLKDILEMENIKNSKTMVDLLRLIAFQIGHEVSLSELGAQLGIDSKTVKRYLDLCEKSFVLFNLRGFHRNLRKEINKKSKYYFYDNGVRNAMVSNFNGLALRNDVGGLWENFIFMERLKKRAYREIPANIYFWRTWEQQEIDLVEERGGDLFGYEFTWGSKKKKKIPSEWKSTYPNAHYEVITPENFLEFIG